MSQPGRSKPSKHGSGKHLASINFPMEMLEFLDKMTKESGINRSALVCAIIQDFMESGKKVRLEVRTIVD